MSKQSKSARNPIPVAARTLRPRNKAGKAKGRFSIAKMPTFLTQPGEDEHLSSVASSHGDKRSTTSSKDGKPSSISSQDGKPAASDKLGHGSRASRGRRTNSDEVVAVVSPSRKKKAPVVQVKDLREMGRNASDRVDELRNYVPRVATGSDGSSNPSDDDEDDENVDTGPIFRSWVAKSTPGEDFVQSSVNFTIAEFRGLWTEVQHIMKSNWNVGSGRRSGVHPMDALLMTMSHLKQGEPFAVTARIFGMKADMYRRVCLGVIDKCAEDILDYFIATDNMTDYREAEKVFENFPSAMEAVDVTFQQSYARGEDFETKKVRFSGKHKAYGFKTEVAVGPDGRARYVSPPYPGSHHDFKIFKKHLKEHKERLRKDEMDIRHDDDMPFDHLDEQYYWAAIMDRGYEGAPKLGRFITPKKKSARRDLDHDDLRKNDNIEHDRVIVENYFGRNKGLWGAAERRYRLEDDMYGKYMQFCFGLTNYHVSLLPLRADDGDVERNYYARLRDRYEVATAKRKAQQDKSRRRHKARRLVAMATANNDGDLSDISGDLFDHTEDEGDDGNNDDDADGARDSSNE